MAASFLTLLLLLLANSAAPSPTPSLHGTRRVEELSPHLKVEWSINLNTSMVEFTLKAQATGWVGFGLSVSGTMKGADIIISGVHPDGTPYFDDYHGVGHVQPVRDESQDWELRHASEASGETTLSFHRPLRPCDTATTHDVPITGGTVKLIWALGKTDMIAPHTPTSRGALAVNLLDPPLAPIDLDAPSMDLDKVQIQYTLDGSQTAYWCTVHKRVSSRKSHIVAFKPILNTPAALKHTHHFNLYLCKGPMGKDPGNLEEELQPLVGRTANCSELRVASQLCDNNVYAWSFGGRFLVLPENVGFPWGHDRTEYFLFQVHFDNPESEEDVRIQTGVEIYHTKELRRHEAGFLSMGHSLTPALMVPPRTGNWTIVGHCSSLCTNKALSFPRRSIRLFNVNLHSHKSSRAMRLRHFRSGLELVPIAQDDTYDFDFQENRPLPEEVEVLPGDHLTLECTYDSNWRSPHSVIAGEATTDEMCMAFLLYWPRMAVESCFSEYPRSKLLRLELLGGKQGVEWSQFPSVNPKITRPSRWKGLQFSQFLDEHVGWTEANKAELQEELRYGGHTDLCELATGWLSVTYPDFEEEYKERANCTPPASKLREVNHSPNKTSTENSLKSSEGVTATSPKERTSSSKSRVFIFLLVVLIVIAAGLVVVYRFLTVRRRHAFSRVPMKSR